MRLLRAGAWRGGRGSQGNRGKSRARDAQCAHGGLLEQVIERLLGARGTRGGRRGFCFTLNGGPRFEVRALVARILRRYANRYRALAFERRAGVEVGALGAAVKVGGAPRALPGRARRDGDGQLVAAAGALHHFAEAGHVERLRRDRRLPAGGVFFFLLLRLALARLARLVLVAALPVLAVRHGERWDCIAFRSPVSPSVAHKMSGWPNASIRACAPPSRPARRGGPEGRRQGRCPPPGAGKMRARPRLPGATVQW